jgi:hypothetical protein
MASGLRPVRTVAFQMQTFDFARSFVTFRVDTLKKPPGTMTHEPAYTLNNARVPIECHCEITEKATGQVQEFVLGANCKTERVGAVSNLFTEPNADFSPVFSPGQFLLLKAFDRADKGVLLHPPSLGVQPERQSGLVSEAFDRVKIEMVRCAARELGSAADIVAAVLGNQVLVAQTRFASDRYRVVLEYPVKTINANEREMIYQTDTGPVLFPDLRPDPPELIRGLELAFAAFNQPLWTEFLLRVRTPVADSISVYHYSQAVRIDCVNRLFQLGRPRPRHA